MGISVLLWIEVPNSDSCQIWFPYEKKKSIKRFTEWIHSPFFLFRCVALCGRSGHRCLNPILTGGGGGQFDPPCTKSTTASRPPQIATRLFMTFFFQVLRIFWYQVCENWTIGREVTWRFVLSRRHKICPKSAFCIMFECVQNTWKLLIILKCSKTVFILSFWPFAQFLISWN